MKKFLTPLLALAIAAFSTAAAAAAPVVEVARTVVVAVGEKLHDVLFGYLVKTGAVLGMAEFNSRQITALASTPKVKMQPYDNGSPQLLVASTPAAAAWAQNDTFVIGQIPKGSRILRSGKVWHGAFGASVTLAIGVRDAVTKVAIDAAGLLTATSAATAGLVKNIDTGALLNQVGGYITTADVEVYATLAGADPTDNIQAEFEIPFLTNSPT